VSENPKKYQSVDEFYVFYLTQHSLKICRLLHIFGTLSAIVLGLFLIWFGQYKLLPFTLVVGYGSSWFGHFYYEKNRPATFKYPLYSFICDFKMIKDFFQGTLDNKVIQALKN
jgi:hypothetical protein